MSITKKNLKPKDKPPETIPIIPPKTFQIEKFDEEQLMSMLDGLDESTINFKETVQKMGTSDAPFLFYPMDMCKPIKPHIVDFPKFDIETVEYLMTACEVHAMDYLGKMDS